MLRDPHIFSRNDLRTFRAALAFMRRHFRAGLRVADVAKHVGRSECYFNSRFTTWHGKTPKAVLTGLQIEEAKRLILAGHRLEDVAARCGFPDRSYLCFRFRRVTGTTPAIWRQRHGVQRPAYAARAS